MTVTETETRAPEGQLLRVLGATFGVAVAVGAMIGAGILRAPAAVARDVPDARIMLGLWALGAVYVALQANIAAELATSMPRVGGAYVYVKRAMGSAGGLAVGWTDWMTFVAAIAALSVACADFLALLWPASARLAPLPAVLIQLTILALNAVGLREGRRLQEITSLIKAFALAAFCVAAIVVAMRAHPVARPVATHPPVTWTGIIAAFQLIAGAYAGWIAPAHFSEENCDPGRSIPRAMGSGIVFVALLYLVVNGALLAALGNEGMRTSALPFTAVLASTGSTIAGTLFALCAMLSVASCANAQVMAAPRVLLALARDGLLPAVFRRVNRGGSPYVGLVLTAVVTTALTVRGSFAIAFGLIATLNAAAGVLVIAAYFVLRHRAAELHRPFRAIAHPWLPALGGAITLALFFLFLGNDWRGAAFALALWLLCIPFAYVARRMRGPAPAAV